MAGSNNSKSSAGGKTAGTKPSAPKALTAGKSKTAASKAATKSTAATKPSTKVTAKARTTSATATVKSAAKKTASKSAPKKPGAATKGPLAAPAKLSGNKMSKEQFRRVDEKTAAEIMDLLCKRYPDAECELDYRNDFELLTAVILSAQTTDANVNKATPKLFARFPDAKSLAEAPIDEVKECIRSTGYYNAKAQNIQACAQGLVTKFGGKVPMTVEELTTLPGVGRKTANVVLGVVHNIPGWTVDTHVQRLSKRLGFSELEDPVKIEKDLQKLFPERDWSQYSITLIWHGRRCCEARKPDCANCPVNHICPSSQV